MKKLLIFVLALICMLGLFGCGKETDQADVVVGGDLIPQVMVDGVIYVDMDTASTTTDKEADFDGKITSKVDQSKQPTENDQSNFGTGYCYRFRNREGTIELYMNNKWWIFATEDVRQSIQHPEQLQEYSFKANVLEVNDNHLLVEPVDGSTERNSSDKIELGLKDKTSWPVPQVGDMVNVVYDGLIQETYPARIPNPYRVEIVAEPTMNNWGVTLEAKNVTPKGLMITCNHAGGENTVELQTGSYYIVQRLEDDGYVEVPFIPQKHQIAWTAEAWIIEKEGETNWDVNWEWLYGELPTGKYRIGKEIVNFRDTGDYDTEIVYAEFEIK